MTSPTFRTIDPGAEAWDADANANFSLLADVGLPLKIYASSGALPSASLNKGVLCAYENGASITVVVSDGTSWRTVTLGA